MSHPGCVHAIDYYPATRTDPECWDCNAEDWPEEDLAPGTDCGPDCPLFREGE